MSVLEAVLRIQDEQDPSLAFRYACRGAICGSCGMSINGKLNLACRVQLHTLPTARVVIGAAAGFRDHQRPGREHGAFWEKYQRVQPWLHAEISAAKENRMTEAERERIDQYVHCILCGLCYAACPAKQSNEAFTGPAALAKLYRFLADSRDDSGNADASAGELGAGRLGLPHDHEMRRSLPQGRSARRRHPRCAAGTPPAENAPRRRRKPHED